MTHLPNGLALKMDGAERAADAGLKREKCSFQVGGRGRCGEAETQVSVKQRLVQILVVVANIQMGALKTEVGKGSMGTVFGHG